jgi:hypothetical protein
MAGILFTQGEIGGDQSRKCYREEEQSNLCKIASLIVSCLGHTVFSFVSL